MTVPLEAVAIAFGIATIICIADIFIARVKPRKIIRMCEAVILFFASGYYIQAASNSTVPSPELRFLWVCLAIVICAEIISKWDLRLGRKK